MQALVALRFKELQVHYTTLCPLRTSSIVHLSIRCCQAYALQSGVTQRQVNMAFDKQELIELILSEGELINTTASKIPEEEAAAPKPWGFDLVSACVDNNVALATEVLQRPNVLINQQVQTKSVREETGEGEWDSMDDEWYAYTVTRTRDFFADYDNIRRRHKAVMKIGNTALDMAEQSGATDVARVLREHGAKSDEVVESQQNKTKQETPLDQAMQDLSTDAAVVQQAQMVCNAPDQVTLAGHDGARAKYMGTYGLTAEVVHDGPLYAKSSGAEGYLFRNNNPKPDRIGKWMVTDNRESVDENVGLFLSAEAAELPSQPGLVWQIYEDGWHDEPGITCTH